MATRHIIFKVFAYTVMVSGLLATMTSCGDSDDPVTVDPGQSMGTVSIDCEPDDIQVAWYMFQPGGLMMVGVGDSTMTDMETGTYQVTWGLITGWATPESNPSEMSLAADSEINFRAVYTDKVRTITVNAEPESIGAGWHLIGPDGLEVMASGDSVFTDMPPGEYVLIWQPVADWFEPEAQIAVLTAGQHHEFVGEYAFAHRPGFGEDSTFEVMTWNLEQFAKNGSTTVQQAIFFIEGLDVDIIALQEIASAAYFDQLANGLPGWAGARANSASYSMDLAFLYRVDGEVQVSAVHEILTGYSREFPRRPYVLEGSLAGTNFAVINNHYKCCGDGIIDESEIYDEETRRRDASLLIDDYIRTNYPDRAVFVVGDLNDELTDSPENNVFQNFLDAADTYRFVDLAIAQDPAGQWSFPNWPSHIDHILITSQLFDAYDGRDAVVKVFPLHEYLVGGWYEYDRNLSDHLPVGLKLAWP